jgi:hypothetical protein
MAGPNYELRNEGISSVWWTAVAREYSSAISILNIDSPWLRCSPALSQGQGLSFKKKKTHRFAILGPACA